MRDRNNTISSRSQKFFFLFWWLTFLALLGMAWKNRFIQDDAFISFRYAFHSAQGQGLVWNLGELVEGYTNFLWVLILRSAFMVRPEKESP
jgi:hypothetical protein